MKNSEWHDKTMELVRKHKLGFLNNPGGGQFTRQVQEGEKAGVRTEFSIQVSAMDDENDYKTLLAGLKRLGVEPTMTPEEAEAAGYKVIPASPFEVGLTKNGRGVRTWWSQTFDGKLPPLSHPKIMEAVKAHEEVIAEFGER